MSARTTRPTLPEFLRSPIVGGMISAHLSELADVNEHNAQESGKSRVRAAEVALLRRASREIDDFLVAEQ